MTTNPETPARYAALLKELRINCLPMATVSGEALTLTFAFDTSHRYTPLAPLLDKLSKVNDQELLEAETYGGRLARHEYLMTSLETMVQLADVVEAPEEWEQVIDVAENLHHACDRTNSFSTFADLVDDALLAIQPDAEDDHESAFVEMQELDDNDVPLPHSVDWAHINLEFFMAYTGGTVDRIQYTYPGHGPTAVLTLVCDDGTKDRYQLTAPANPAAARLLEHNYECHDALKPVPVMAMINAMPEAEATAMLATMRTDAGAIMLDEHTCPKDKEGNGTCVLLQVR